MVLGFLVSVLSFPGVIVHEYAHKKFCELTGVRVKEVVYLRLGNPMGYVAHEPATNFKQSFSITAAPFLVNTLFAVFFGFLFGLVGVLMHYTLIPRNFLTLLGFLSIWLGISMGIHAIPSSQDAKNLWNFSKKSSAISSSIGLPIAAVIYSLDRLRYLWIDVVYAVLVFGFSAYIILNIAGL